MEQKNILKDVENIALVPVPSFKVKEKAKSEKSVKLIEEWFEKQQISRQIPYLWKVLKKQQVKK